MSVYLKNARGLRIFKEEQLKVYMPSNSLSFSYGVDYTIDLAPGTKAFPHLDDVCPDSLTPNGFPRVASWDGTAINLAHTSVSGQSYGIVRVLQYPNWVNVQKTTVTMSGTPSGYSATGFGGAKHAYKDVTISAIKTYAYDMYWSFRSFATNNTDELDHVVELINSTTVRVHQINSGVTSGAFTYATAINLMVAS